MASAISLEYLQSITGQEGGLATLDTGGRLPMAQLPEIMVPFKGEFATSAELIAEHDTGRIADYAYVTDTMSFWYWNANLDTPAWVNQLISAEDYLALSAAARAAVPYITTIE